MQVKEPLFIIGTGRCGTTIFHQIFSYHPEVTWLSPWCLKYPNKPERNHLAMRLLDMPLPDKFVRKVVYTGEFYPFWDYYFGGFSEPCRDLLEEDASERTKAILRKVMERLIYPKRDRLLLKITGWSRVGFLKAIFPDAKFIHIYRDGRSVVNSWLNIHWWSGWRGPENWRWGQLRAEHQAKWEKYNKSFVVLAGLEWEILMEAFEKAKQTIAPENLLEFRYEELCENPVEIFRTSVEFSNLTWLPEFESKVRSFSLRNTNDKWKKDLNAVQQKMLNEALAEALEKYGYV